jgi:Adenylate and Guanylate cyclase catalytic domain
MAAMVAYGGNTPSPASSLVEGWVAVADIVGYSLKPDEVQRDTATFLVRAIESTFLFRRILVDRRDYGVACTGDGFILVVADEAIPQRGHEILRFVEEIQSLVRAYEGRLQAELGLRPETEFKIRFGIHRGAFAFEQIFGQRNAIGTGVNMACRVAGYGDADHIILSADAARALPCERLVKGQYVDPIGEAGVKHNIGIYVYAYFRESQDGPKGAEGTVLYGRRDNPKAAIRQIAIDKLITEELRRIEEGVSDYLNSRSVSKEESRIRLTILAPTEDQKYLTVTQYRYLALEPVTKSDIAFHLLGPEGPQGVAAEAFVRDRTVMVTELADRLRDFAAYCEGLKAHCLSEDDIVGLRRPCRSFVATPIRLPVSKNARLVLALDSLHPLFPAESEEMRDMQTRVETGAKQLALYMELKEPLPMGKARKDAQ